MNAINNILSHFNPKPESLDPGICPQCGSNILRRVRPFPEITGHASFTLYSSKDELEYGEWECVDHHIFTAEPERWSETLKEPVGIKIT